MSFTGTDLRTLAQAEIDDFLLDTDVIQNVNTCLVEFAELFRRTAVQTVTVTDTSAFIPRTAGHMAVVGITDGTTGAEYRGNWELSYDRTQIRIRDKGMFNVVALIIPPFIVAVSDTIDVHAAFRVGMARYIGGLFKSKDNDLSPEGVRMRLEGTLLIKNVSTQLTNADRRPGGTIPVRRSAGKWTEPNSIR